MCLTGTMSSRNRADCVYVYMSIDIPHSDPGAIKIRNLHPSSALNNPELPQIEAVRF